ncbi:TonB-dependent receptor [Marinilabiliaceae bacterium JC040]|nr:TonB-dependent receptor [Marinilabiliaceae bacterium JC040]
MRNFIIIILMHLVLTSFGQNINGKVLDTKNKAIPGVNVYISGSYSGAMTNINGIFNFKTKKEGIQILIITCIGYKEKQIKCSVKEMNNLEIILEEKINTLNTVTITAGSFSAGDKSKTTALNSLDVVTTAGAAANLVVAFQKLPGTTINPESCKLFIRGGNSYESQTFIDGLRVFKPYSSSPNNIPSRSRYSAMLFKGMNLSTGGYSAEYGQALSGILLLNTNDVEEETKTDISIMTVGLGLGQTIKGKNNSLTFNSSYTNLRPYLKLIPSRYKWSDPYESLGGEAVYRHKTKKGIFKLYTGVSTSSFKLFQEDINYKQPINYSTKEEDIYTNTTYKGEIGNKLILYTGMGFSNNHKTSAITNTIKQQIKEFERNYHLKITLKKIIDENFKIHFGSEYFIEKSNQTLSSNKYSKALSKEIKEQMGSIFLESEIRFFNNTAFRIGIRGEQLKNNKSYLSPRIGLAQKIGETNQISFAYGTFNQKHQKRYQFINNKLANEKSHQYIFNFQHNSRGRILRTEVYYKRYSNLIKYRDINDETSYTNKGKGYSKGIDILWKDSKSIRNLDYMISYSFIDAKRNYKYYPYEVNVPFTAKHNLSISCRYWISSLKTLISTSYSFNSGRPYHNPNKKTFMNETSNAYNDLSLSFSYLISQQTILYLSINNLLGFNNIYSYKYANNRNDIGIYERQNIRPSQKRFIMLGLFITLSKNKKLNQLDTL